MYFYLLFISLFSEQGSFLKLINMAMGLLSKRTASFRMALTTLESFWINLKLLLCIQFLLFSKLNFYMYHEIALTTNKSFSIVS